MQRAIIVSVTALALLAGCDSASVDTPAEATADKPEAAASSSRSVAKNYTTSATQSPVQIEYRTIGTPIVSQPVAIELEFRSTLGTQAFDVSYRITDTTALQLGPSQPATASIVPDAEEGYAAQQVTVIPLREGRLFLNVGIALETEGGTFRSVMAVPIEAGSAAAKGLAGEALEADTRGTVTTDENGELIRTLPAKTE